VIAAAAFGAGLIVGSAGTDSGTENGSQTEQTVTVTSIVEKIVEAPASTAEAATPTTAAKPKATRPSAPPFTDGVWAVPSEVKPGMYATAGAELCYWARLRDAGDPNSIIVNSFGQAGRQRVTIRSSDGGFQSRDCGEWRKVG
jgi:hypothetical protein